MAAGGAKVDCLSNSSQSSRRTVGARGTLGRRGFTLVEVMIAVVIIALAVAPSISAIQSGRIAARSTSLEVIGQDLASSMMELIKRSGFDEIVYGGDLPTIMDTAATVSPLLELPRQIGSSGGATANTLPGGPPGSVSDTAMEAFLTGWRAGTVDRGAGVVTSSTNYLFFSDDQIAALSGYDNAADVPEEVSVLNAQYCWGFFVTTDPAGGAGGAIGYPLKHVTVVVKWRDVRRNRPQYVAIESYVSAVGPRL
jgi:prepilin-type N-terminal cleavage/methylation domain-containing protein